MIAFSFTECAGRRDWTTLRFTSISWRRRKKISVIILKSALRDLNLLALTFLTFPCHFRHIFVAKLFIIVMRNLEALSEGFYLHNMYRYLEINKLYWSLHELGAYPSHSSSSWVSLKKIGRKGSIIVFLWISRRKEIKS